MKGEDKRLKEALIKKALGFDATEVVEEYSSDGEGEIKLTKKKVTKKNVPPDLSAIKMLIDEKESTLKDVSDVDLEKEKERLIETLKKEITEKEKKIEKTGKGKHSKPPIEK